MLWCFVLTSFMSNFEIVLVAVVLFLSSLSLLAAALSFLLGVGLFSLFFLLVLRLLYVLFLAVFCCCCSGASLSCSLVKYGRPFVVLNSYSHVSVLSWSCNASSHTAGF